MAVGAARRRRCERCLLPKLQESAQVRTNSHINSWRGVGSALLWGLSRTFLWHVKSDAGQSVLVVAVGSWRPCVLRIGSFSWQQASSLPSAGQSSGSALDLVCRHYGGYGELAVSFNLSFERTAFGVRSLSRWAYT